MTPNSGGIVLQTGLARLCVVTLSPDFLCWHELGSGRAAIPPSHEALKSAADGPGTGFVVAWKMSLRLCPHEATPAFDGGRWIAALLPLLHVGRLLVQNVHLQPGITYEEWMQQVRRMEQLQPDLQPDYSFLSGHFNAADAADTPLPTALAPSGALPDHLHVIPTCNPTNHTIVQSARQATAIDHVFIQGPVAKVRHQSLPSRSSHAVRVVTVTLLTASEDAWAWRRFRWCRASLLELDILGANNDSVWGWLSLTSALRDDYVASHQRMATQIIPQPPDTRQLIHRLPQRSFPLGPEQLDLQISAFREAADAREAQNRGDVVRLASIVSTTSSAVQLPSPPLEPFSGILPRPGVTLPTRDARVREVHSQ